MLPEKSWKTDAILRLFASVVVCWFIGFVLQSTIRHFHAPSDVRPASFLAVTAGSIVCFIGGLVVLGRRWTTDRFVWYFGFALGFVYAGFVLAWWQSSMLSKTAASASGDLTINMFIFLCSFQGAALVLMFRFLREHQLTWSEAFGLRLQPLHAIVLGAQIAIVATVLLSLMQKGLSELLDHFGMAADEQIAVKIVREAVRWPNRLVLAVGTLVIAPPAEEILFRGVLYPALKRAGYPRLALWGTAFMFAGIHMNLLIFLPLMVLALALTWLYERTGNLLAPIAAHSLFNGINFVMIFYASTIEEKIRSWLQHSGHS